MQVLYVACDNIIVFKGGSLQFTMEGPAAMRATACSASLGRLREKEAETSRQSSSRVSAHNSRSLFTVYAIGSESLSSLGRNRRSHRAVYIASKVGDSCYNSAYYRFDARAIV